ncbi:MAG: LysR family transcriptional regulator [Hyphomicrobiales bacterium]|nr:MAG: LysR family transcriptional regulator [Hyphomicrobiales bacterium]
MRLRHIEVLHAVRRTGSTSAAAAALSITQPAVSKILKHAEQQLGFQLFRRLRGRLLATDEAETLFLDIERVYEALERTRHTATVLREGLEIHLRIACLPSLGMGVVPRAIHLFRSRRPRTFIEVATRHEREMMDGLLGREFDVGLSFGPSEGYGGETPGIVSKLISTGEMVYIDTPGRSPSLNGMPMKLAKIDAKRLIGLNDTHYLGLQLKAAMEESGLAFSPPVQVQTYYIARNIVAAGTGCAVVDEFTAAAPYLAVSVRPIDPPLRFGIYAHTRERHPFTKRAGEFLDSLREVCEADRLAPRLRAQA